MDDEVKEYWEGFDAAEAKEEEDRVTNFTGRRAREYNIDG